MDLLAFLMVPEAIRDSGLIESFCSKAALNPLHCLGLKWFPYRRTVLDFLAIQRNLSCLLAEHPEESRLVRHHNEWMDTCAERSEQELHIIQRLCP